MAKVCRKHKIQFNGLRCPKCTAPPVIQQGDAPPEDLPFEDAQRPRDDHEGPDAD